MSSLAEMLSRHSFLAANSRVHAVRTWVFRNLMDYAAVEQCLQASNDTRLKIRESFAVEARDQLLCSTLRHFRTRTSAGAWVALSAR
jgi:hypothetical protein